MDNLANKLMRTTLLLLIACFVSVAAFGQSVGKLMRQGNKRFEREEYREAIPFYEKVLAQEPNNSLALFRAGVSYLSYDKEKSIDYVNRAVKQNPKVSKDVSYWLGRISHINYNFDEAISHYRAYQGTLKKNNTEAVEEIAKRIQYSRNAKEQFNNQKDIFLRNLGPNINTAYSEHSPVISSNDAYLLYTTRSEETAVGKEKQQGEYFEHIVESNRAEDGTWSKPASLSRVLNSKGHDASIQLFDNDTKMLMYRNDKNGDIFVSEKTNGEWSAPVALGKNINTKAFESDAYITPDGQTLYFSTSAYSENGDLDIYVSQREGDGWGKPKSVGPNINTQDDDDSPYLSRDGKTLYFASRGHNSMGGYDIFSSKLQSNGQWGRPENMGYPVNSPDDDTYYRLAPNGQYAYLSSYRIGGYGEKDIWTINYISNAIIKGKVYSQKDSSVVPGVEITFTGTAANRRVITVKDVTKPDSGDYMLSVLSGRKYQITLTRNGEQIMTDEMEVPVVTSDTATFTKDFWLPYRMTAQDSLDALGRYAFRNIYFDTDVPRAKSDDPGLRPESIQELNKIVNVMRQFSDVTLYVDGHTDSRNTDAYNQRLSERRSAAAYNYLVKNGIPAKRLQRRNYGEKRPVAPNDSPENMQLNRRVEFNIKSRGSMPADNTGKGRTSGAGTGTGTNNRSTGTTNTGTNTNRSNATGTGTGTNRGAGTTAQPDEMKIKSGDTKIKMEEGEFKYKDDATDTKIKQEEGEMKIKSGDTKIKVEQKKK